MSLTETTTEERQAQKTYNALLAHLDDCSPCQSEEDCAEGTRIRRAVRATRSAVTESPALRAARAQARMATRDE
ncbi:hypothetical protein AB0N81_37815 [Streptomyces sp. NPDC093510]|uniref:hypothetical protein n=1 Tax=Streptomyces sp. NPDC093510 TaxID=3155199 RepID=UPI00341629A5